MSTISALANAIAIVPNPSTNVGGGGGVSTNNTTNTNNSSSNTNSNNNTTVGTPTQSNLINNSIPNFNNQIEEKVYKKEKQILIEFEAKTKDLKSQLNEGSKCLEQRLDTQISILLELQDFFKKRAEVELQYSRDLDKLTKQIYARHKSEKSKRETWHLHSASKLWESLLNDTKQHSKYHQVAGEICSKYVADKFDDIIDDIKRIFSKCKSVGQSAHEEIFKVVGELNGAMKTYHEYQSESKQAEAKLKYVQSQKPKYEKQKSKKKLKQYEKQVEKRLQKYTETKVKAFKARNEYILSIDSANACINKFCKEDVGDLVDCMDFGFHASVAKCIYMYLSAQENIKRSRQMTVDNMSRSIGDLDSNADKNNYLDYFSFVFNIQKKFQFEPHKGDEVSQVNAQSLIRYEMEKRFEQLDNRLKTLKTENDEIFKTIEATEQSLLSYFDVKNCDMSDLFRDLNLTNQNTAMNKPKRIEIEDYYVEKVRQFTTSSNLIARLEARHSMMQKALMGCVNSNNNDKLFDKFSDTVNAQQQDKKKKIGKSPIIGQPRLFGGKLIEYINATKQEIPPIITSCIKAINRLGLHNQGIFRIPGSQLEINQFKDSFEKGEDPLITVNPREMNSVAGVLKLYLRELKDPVFPREMYDTFINAMRISSNNNNSSSSQLSSPANQSNQDDSDSNNISLSPVENIEAMKVENIRKAMCNVPKPIYIVLRYIFAFLNHLSEFKDENMMDSYNIAICLAPTLIPVPDDKKDQVNNQTDTIELIKLIIQHNDQIFSMECDGPVYEKFDSEFENEEENIEESDDDDEDESERQINRNISDDESFATEAIALYDYKGRSDKELSFKKGSVLAIKGQLSADWWQGSIISSSNTNGNSNSRIGYIPDKYIALRSCKRKKSITLTPGTLSTPSNNNSNLISTPSIKNGHHSHLLTSSKRSNSNDLELNKSNLSENLAQVKESDILNDDDNSNSNDNVFAHQIKNTINSNNSNGIRSPSSYLSYKHNNSNSSFPIKKRISSSSSNSVSDNLNINSSQHPSSYLTLSNHKSPKYALSSNINNNSLDDLLLNNKQQLKMNQIEDALASVLDDMKQLDFSTTPSLLPNNNANSNNYTYKTNGIKTNGHLANVNKTNTNSNNGSTKLLYTDDENLDTDSSSLKTKNRIITTTSAFSRNSDLFTNLYQNNKQQNIISKPNTAKDQDTDLQPSTPNRIVKTSLSSPPIENNLSPSLNSGVFFPSSSVANRRLSVDQTKMNVNKLILNNTNANGNLQCSSTSSTESSSISSITSSKLIMSTSNNLTNQSSLSTKLLCEAAAAAAAAIDSSGSSNLITGSTSSITKHQTGKIVNLPTPHVPVVLMSTNLLCNDIDDDDDDEDDDDDTNNSEDCLTSCKTPQKSNDSNNIINSTNSGGSSDNLIDDTSKISNSNGSSKKQPPPLMKKPEKSDEILRKLGRSPPTDLMINPNQPPIQSCSSSTSSTSTVSSLSSTSNNSPIGSTTNSNKTNLSMRLTNSKATDV